MGVEVRFLGTGDAFGSGGRLQTCFCVKCPEARFLIDCGASALISMRRFGVAPNEIDLILLSHLHGDHFGGVPFFLLDAQFASRRTAPLTIAGPEGTGARIEQAMEVFFPGSSDADRGFEVRIVELAPGRVEELHGITVQPFVVSHPSGAPPLALRIGCEGRTLTYSGDTEWTEALVPAAQGADLLIAEAYAFDKQIKYHLDLRTLLDHAAELGAKRLVITHMSEDVLDRLDSLECEYAEDGKVIEI